MVVNVCLRLLGCLNADMRAVLLTRDCPCPLLHHRHAGREPSLPDVGRLLPFPRAERQRLVFVDASRLEHD